MSDQPDRVPQGSIPPVLDKAEQVLSDLSFHYVQWHGIDTPVEQSRRHMLLVAADSIRQLLTALRSLPPVPMQQLIEQWRLRARRYALVGNPRADAFNLAADELAAALRSLASPQAEHDQKDATRVDGQS